ncbi:MAG: hypothetical protein ACRYFS_04405 [Janthinobacterium lividum]
MENNTDYECYLLGCRSAAMEPHEEWRFRLLQEEFLRRAAAPEQQDYSIPSYVLEHLVSLIAQGYKIAAGGSTAEGDEPGAAACGVREPRVPPEPVLVGSAARSMPTLNAPDESFWRV